MPGEHPFSSIERVVSARLHLSIHPGQRWWLSSAVVAVDGALVIAQGRYSVIGHGIDELGIRMQGYPPGYDLTVEAVDRGNLPVLCDDTACRLRA